MTMSTFKLWITIDNNLNKWYNRYEGQFAPLKQNSYEKEKGFDYRKTY